MDGPGYDYRSGKGRPNNTWAEVKKDALNAYCATLRIHNTPDAIVQLYRKTIQDALTRLQESAARPADWEWGHRLT